jgi:hypothetical protein
VNITQSPKVRAFDWLHSFLALVVLAWLNVGMAGFGMSYVPNYVRWGLFAIWFILSIFYDKGFASIFVVQSWPLLVLMFYMLLMASYGAADVEIYEYPTSYLLVVYSIFLYYFRDKYRPIQLMFTLCLIADVLVVGIRTYFELGKNPLLARYLSTASVDRHMILGDESFPGIGGYGYAYALGAIILALGYLLLNGVGRKPLIGLLLVGSISLLIKASFSIAIILVTILLVVVTIIRVTRKYDRVAMALSGLLVAGLVIGVSVPLLVYLSATDFLPREVSVRLAELAMGPSASGTDLHGRMSLYGQSVTVFQQNFFFGAAADASGASRPGGHATWLDLLAMFGLFATTMVIFLAKAYRFTVDRVGDEFRQLIAVIWLYFMILGMVNTLLFTNVFIAWFLLLPMSTTLFRRLPNQNESLPRSQTISG